MIRFFVDPLLTESRAAFNAAVPDRRELEKSVVMIWKKL